MTNRQAPPVTIEVKGDRAYRRRLGDNLVGGALSRLLRDASNHAQDKAKKGLGRSVAANSILSEVRPTSARVFSMMSDARTASIEVGRPPGDPLIHPDALRRWARKSSYPYSVFKLAFQIQRRGVKGRFFMRAAIASTRSRIPELSRRMARDIEKRFARRRP